MTTSDSPLNDPAPLQEVVEENKQVAEDIKKAVDDLTVVHAVLTVENEKSRPSQDTKKAVKRTKVIRSKLANAATKLEDATEILERHVAASAQK